MNKGTVGELLRRANSSFIKKRSRVRVVPAVQPTLSTRPIFLVGLYRSGTTLLRYVVDSHSSIACPPESDFIAFLAPLTEDPRSVVGFGGLGFNAEHLRLRLREFVAYFFESYADSVGKARWADKSPYYVDHLDFIDHLFPEAQYVIIHRHPLDQVHSHTRGGTYADARIAPYVEGDTDIRIGAAKYWADKTSQILDFVERNGERCVTIRYEDMCATPEEVLHPVFAFLGEPWESNVLRYYEFAHDLGRESGRVAATRGFVANEEQYMQWPLGLVRDCVALVEPVMQVVGYDPNKPIAAHPSQSHSS